jgi:diguanylate cyclase (GGDEF)-like protein/PAS domain S-box-containing protein
MFLASILIGNILHARRYQHYTFNIYLGISLVAVYFVYMFLTGGVNRSGAFIWYYTFPLMSFFILGSKRGAAATILVVLPVIGLFLLKNPPSFFVNYSVDFKIRFISSFFLVFVLSFLFEYSQERNRQELRIAQDELEKRVGERTWALQEAVHELEKEISERNRIEKALRESEERFRQLAENIREVFYISEKGVTQYVSPAYEDIWGRPPQSLYRDQKSVWDTVHPKDRDRVMRSLPKKNKGEVEEVYRIVRPDGSIRWIKDRSFPIYDDSGKAHRIVGIAADITDLKLGEEKLKYLSLHDPLTGLYNRIYFEEEMSRIEKARYDRVGIVSCDVDGLKLVNDTLGHDHGDNLLVTAAKVIKECFREGDLVARIGGDEFSAILPNTTESAVENACQRIQDAVAAYNATNPELPLSISVGFAIKNGIHKNLKDVFKEADNNMYREKLYRTQSVRSTIVKSLIDTMKARDFTTEKHVIRLEKLLISLAALIGLSESTQSDLSLLAKFHDIGKVGISDSILFKEGPLTSEEWKEMMRHCEIGYRIALSASELIPIADWILKHHEWWNGQGYPFGIKGEEIPIECRLLAIADAYEAMTSVRPYRRAFSHEEAVAELIKNSGTQFDPKLLKKFLQMVESHPSELELNASAGV